MVATVLDLARVDRVFRTLNYRVVFPIRAAEDLVCFLLRPVEVQAELAEILDHEEVGVGGHVGLNQRNVENELHRVEEHPRRQ